VSSDDRLRDSVEHGALVVRETSQQGIERPGDVSVEHLDRRGAGVREHHIHRSPVPRDRPPLDQGASLDAVDQAGEGRLLDAEASGEAPLAGEEFGVDAEELHGPEREHHWQEITTAAPGFAEYATRTDRTIPVIRLTGRAA
jgi:hypothetical protein